MIWKNFITACGLYVSVTTTYGIVDIYNASLSGDIGKILEAINIGQTINRCQNCDKNRILPIHLAVKSKNIEAVKLLLDFSSPINSIAYKFLSPLHIAIEEGLDDIATLLIERGANVNIAGPKNYTPLHAAARYLRTRLVELLIKNGADVNAIELTWHHTPLFDALVHDDKNAYFIAKMLLKAGASPNVVDLNHNTPLMLAVGFNNQKLTNLLIEYNAIINEPNNSNVNPFILSRNLNLVAINNIIKDHNGSEYVTKKEIPDHKDENQLPNLSTHSLLTQRNVIKNAPKINIPVVKRLTSIPIKPRHSKL